MNCNKNNPLWNTAKNCQNKLSEEIITSYKNYKNDQAHYTAKVQNKETWIKSNLYDQQPSYYYRKSGFTRTPLISVNPIASSLHTMEKVALQSEGNISVPNYEDYLDTLNIRNDSYVTNAGVPSRGNSTKRSLTRLRPGNACGGIGVDIKHGSYERYLIKLKGHTIKPNANNCYCTDE
jgi:hypothetical protein